MKDFCEKDLRDLSEEELSSINFWAFRNEKEDRMTDLFGETWYKKLNVEKLKNTLVSCKVFCPELDEWGIVYTVFVGRGTDYPVLLVAYNIKGGGHGARFVEFLDLILEGDSALLGLN